MRAVVQRVAEASVSVGGDLVGRIGRGLLVLLGVAVTDGPGDADWMASKLVGMRIFENSQGKFDRSVVEVEGEILIVSQFTLHADTRKGRRPSFAAAAPAADAEKLYSRVAERIAQLGVPVRRGSFGARMQVSSTNDGPVTILVDSNA